MHIANTVFRNQSVSAIRVPVGILIMVVGFKKSPIVLLRCAEKTLIVMQVLTLLSAFVHLVSLATRTFNVMVSFY